MSGLLSTILSIFEFDSSKAISVIVPITGFSESPLSTPAAILKGDDINGLSNSIEEEPLKLSILERVN